MRILGTQQQMMLTRKQQRDLLVQEQIKKNKFKQSESSLNTSLSSELQEGVLVEILDFLDRGNRIQVETDFQVIYQDPQYRRIEDYNHHYQKECLQQLINDQIDTSQCLANHKIKEWVRGKMIDWMLEVFANHSNNDTTFFRAVMLLDAFLKFSFNYSDSDMYRIGVTCIFIASKVEDIYHIALQTIVEVLAHRKFTYFQIKEQELVILEALNYETTFPTHLDLLNYFHYQVFGCSNNQAVEIIQGTSVYILKMCYHDYAIMQFRPMLLVACILGYTIRNYVEMHTTQIGAQFQRQLTQTQQHILKIGDLDLMDYMDCIQRVEELIDCFHNKYPQFENLQRFN